MVFLYCGFFQGIGDMGAAGVVFQQAIPSPMQCFVKCLVLFAGGLNEMR